jgi:uncharacterized protein (TIGR02246 family)
MKRLVTALFVIATLSFCLIATGHAGTNEDQVNAAYQAWNAAFNKGDAKAVAGFYSDDALVLPPSHEVIKGPAAIEKFFAGLFANGVTDHTLDIIEVTGKDELLVSAAKWAAKGKDSKGQPTTFGGVATHVFAKQPDGSMKLKLHTFN